MLHSDPDDPRITWKKKNHRIESIMAILLQVTEITNMELTLLLLWLHADHAKFLET